MLGTRCALPNSDLPDQDGSSGRPSSDCSSGRIGAAWCPTRPDSDCFSRDAATAGDSPAIAECLIRHTKSETRRGVDFAGDDDVHIAAGRV